MPRVSRPGRLADARPFDLPVTPAAAEDSPVADRPSEPAPAQAPPSEGEGAGPADPAAPRATSPIRAPMEQRELGKGGKKHRYLQSLVKELAEGQGFRATIEAPLPAGTGQVDVLLEREGVTVAVEVSVTTPVAHEQENVRKCLNAGYARVAVVLAKSRATSGRYRAAILEALTAEEQERVSFLSPEDVPGELMSIDVTNFKPDSVQDLLDGLVEVSLGAAKSSWEKIENNVSQHLQYIAGRVFRFSEELVNKDR